jgi:hypothetical protein
MKLKHPGGDRKRLILTLELAVVLPAAALVILSALHLKTIQRDRAVEAAIQRDFSQVLKISEKQINRKAYDLVDDVRDEFPEPGEACAATLDKILAAHPYVAHVWTYDPEHGLLFRSQPSRLQEPAFKAEGDYLAKMNEGWMKIEFEEYAKKLLRLAQKGDVPYFADINMPARGDKHLYQSTAFFARANKETGKPEIDGITFDAEYLQNKFFPEMLNTVMSRNVSEAKGDSAPAVMMIHAKNDWAPIAACTGWDGGTPEVERNLEGAFPGLTLAIKLKGTTLEALGDHFVHTSFLILGALSLLLGGGIYI